MGKHGPVDGSRQSQPSTSEKNTTRQHEKTSQDHVPTHDGSQDRK